jgi:branched-chain amino acid transport system substrate-binding protein
VGRLFLAEKSVMALPTSMRAICRIDCSRRRGLTNVHQDGAFKQRRKAKARSEGAPMTRYNRIQGVILTAVLTIGAGLLTGPDSFAQQAPEKIRIGYAVSLTGPFAGPASMLPVANYRLWAKQVNAKGGILIKASNRRIPIEVIEYDDTSNPETAIRLSERLMVDEKVDFVLPPWGTAMNLAVAPVYKKHGYPQLGSTITVNGSEALVKRFDTLFLFGTDSPDFATGLVEILSKLKSEGKINNKVAVLSVADQFGADLNAAAATAFKKGGFETLVNKSYPMASRDLSAEIKQAQESGADTFAGFSYPGDTFMIAGQAQTIGYSPKVFYTAVGTAFPGYVGRFGAKANGVLGAGGWDRTAPGAEDYFKAFKEFTGNEPDRWGSPATYASVQALEQAVEAAGASRPKVIDALRSQTFQTVIGTFQFTAQVRRLQPLVSQWQNGEFVTVEPANLPGAKPIIFPKPQW